MPAVLRVRSSPGFAVLGFALSAGLCGCGFRLAGSEPLPAIVARPYVSFTDSYTDFAREFEAELKSMGAELQPGSQGASAEIDVSRDTLEQRTLSINANNIPTEYLLIYTVTFSVRAADKELLAPQTISLSQDYSFQETVVLAKQHEADVLRAQMARNLVSIALRRIARVQTGS